MPERPQIIGSVVAAYLKEVEARKLLDRVRARAGAELQKVIARPPLPVSWVDADAMAQLADAVVAEAGEKVLSEISFDAMKRKVGPIFGGIAKASVTILRSTPNRVFPRIDSVTALTCRGFSFAYESASESSGTMRIEAVAPLSPQYWIGWEGPLGYVYEICGVSGTVTREASTAPSRSAKFHVVWEQP
jgi:hypothetical protein